MPLPQLFESEPLSKDLSLPSILIIDDDEVDFRAARRILREIFGENLKLGWACGWEEASEALHHGKYDVYLIDYFLGGKTGIELIESCEPEQKPDVFIFLTGHEDRDVDLAATRAGASDYLVKSEITASKLERSIRYALFMARKKEALRQETAAIKAAKEDIEHQSLMHANMAATLSATQEQLKTALARAEESEQKYRSLAQQDRLTGLPNRALFMTQLENMIAHAQRSGKDLALLLLDLDRFKSVNDSLGHPIGDRLLKEVSERLLNCTRKTDTVARLGGDEFAVIATNLMNRDDAAIVAQHIVDALAAPFQIDGHEINTGTSVGIAILNRDSCEIDALLKKADAALYKAKEAGRGGFYFFDAALDSQIRTISILKAELSVALEQKQFFLEYQPQVAATSGKPTGLEALVRWEHPVRGCIAPNDFIPTAESTCLITPLSDWILREACEQARRWSEDLGYEISVAVNLSAVQFKRGQLVETVRRALGLTGLRPACLTLEISETAMLHNIDELEQQFHALAALGVKLAIDDFGTGHAPLAHVKQLPIHKIKIDRSFISEMLTDTREAAVVEAVITLGRNLGVTVVAEGVETRQQMEHLDGATGIEIQGFYIAKPMTAALCTTWLRENFGPDIRIAAAGL